MLKPYADRAALYVPFVRSPNIRTTPLITKRQRCEYAAAHDFHIANVHRNKGEAV